MRRYKLVVTILFVFLIWSPGTSQAELNIEIKGLRSDDGVISFELFNASEQIVSKFEKSIEDKKCLITFKKLACEYYAIRYFHDENSNKELDKNWLGMPTEGYGFSNDAYGFFGPKEFKEWLFELKGDTTIVMKTQY